MIGDFLKIIERIFITPIDNNKAIANCQNDALWEGKSSKLMHCGIYFQSHNALFSFQQCISFAISNIPYDTYILKIEAILLKI